MNNPDWFLILRKWKIEMGSVGVTFPFLYRALMLKSENINSEVLNARQILDDIIYKPVDGYVAQVQQCPDISESVLSIIKVNDKKNRIVFKSSICPSDSENESLGFSDDFHGHYGLKHNDVYNCLKLLLDDAENHISKNEYSKLRIAPGKYQFGDLNEREKNFINSTINLS